MPQVFLGRTKFAFVFRNEKTDSNCWLKVYCKEMVGAYCLNYRLQMYSRNITDTAGPIWHWQEICNPNLIYPRQIEFQQELIIELTYQKVSLQEDSLACGIYYNCTRTKIHHPYYGNPNTSTSTSTTTTSSTTTTKQQKTTSFLTSTVRGPTSQGRKLTDFFFPCISFCRAKNPRLFELALTFAKATAIFLCKLLMSFCIIPCRARFLSKMTNYALPFSPLRGEKSRKHIFCRTWKDNIFFYSSQLSNHWWWLLRQWPMDLVRRSGHLRALRELYSNDWSR